MFFKIDKILPLSLSNTLCRVLAVSIFIALLFVDIFYMNEFRIAGSDFVSFITGAKILISESRFEIYNMEIQKKFQETLLGTGRKGVLPFRNLPPIALLFTPIANTSFITGYQIFFFINLMLLFLVSFSLSKEFGLKKELFFILVFTYWPILKTIFKGQATIIFLIVWLLIYKLFKKDKLFLAGAVSSIFINKIQYLVSLPFFLFLSKGKSKFIKGFILGTFNFLILSVFLVGFKTIISYPSFIWSTERTGFGSFPSSYNTLFSLFYTLASNFSLPVYYSYILNFLFFFLFFLYFIQKSKKSSFDKLFSVTVLFTLSFSIHSWEHDLILLLIPIAIFLGSMVKAVENKHKFTLIIFPVAAYFSFMLREFTYPFFISFILLTAGIILLVSPKLELKH